MGTIAVHEFISLDGVFEDPSWTFEFGFDPKMGETIAKVTGAAKAILLGRTTFEMFAPAWAPRTVEDDPGAPFFNETPKYVVGSRKSTVAWNNSNHLGPYDPATIGKLKDSGKRFWADPKSTRRLPERRRAPALRTGGRITHCPKPAWLFSANS